LSNTSNRLPGGRYGGGFAMGALSALIVGPCVAAPLAGGPLFIRPRPPGPLGGGGVFSLGARLGGPLRGGGGPGRARAASAGALRPRAGAWMEGVKRFFGFLLLAVAVYLVSPVIPVAVQMLAWSALLIVAAVYLRAIDPLPAEAGGLPRLGKGLGVIALL